MIESLIALLVLLVVVGVLLWAARTVIGVIPMDPTLKQVCEVIVVVIAALVVLAAALRILGVLTHGSLI